MADQTISIEHKPGGVATDYDALPALTDAGGTYGLKAAVSGAVVTAYTGATLAKTATGSYAIALTGLAAGTAYTYSLKRTYLGATAYTVRTFTAAAAGLSARYLTLQDLQEYLGPENVSLLSDLNNDEDAATIRARQQRVLDYPCDAIDSCFAGGAWAVPLASLDASDLSKLCEWALPIAANYLYGPRNNRSANKESPNAYSADAEAAWKEMALYKTGLQRKFIAATRSAASVGVSAVCPTNRAGFLGGYYPYGTYGW